GLLYWDGMISRAWELTGGVLSSGGGVDLSGMTFLLMATVYSPMAAPGLLTRAAMSVYVPFASVEPWEPKPGVLPCGLKETAAPAKGWPSNVIRPLTATSGNGSFSAAQPLTAKRIMPLSR